MQLLDALCREAPALQSNLIQRVSVGATLSAGHRIGKHILRDDGAATDISVRADACVLVNRTQRPDHRPLLHGDVPGEGGSVDEHGMIADDAVMSYVCVGHDQYVVSDARRAAALRGTTADGNEFPDDIPVANFQPSGLATIGDVLRVATNCGEGEDHVVASKRRRPSQNHMRVQLAVLAEDYSGAYDAIRANLAGRRDLRRRIDNSCGMNLHGGATSCRPQSLMRASPSHGRANGRERHPPPR